MELLIGINFLPKGDGIVTRTPILIQTFYDNNIKEPLYSFGHNDIETTNNDKVIEEIKK